MSDNKPYLPLWDAKQGAITSYLFSPPAQDAQTPLEGMKAIANAVRDMQTIQTIEKELAEMAESGRRLLIVCPVEYATLMGEASFLEFIGYCQAIPEEHKRYLIFLITSIPENPSQGQLGNRVGILKRHAHRVFGQTEASPDVNFYVLAKTGLDAVGFDISYDIAGEKVLMQLMDVYAREAQASEIKNLFILNISSLSLATSAICAGYRFLGGPAVHAPVQKPDHIYRFAHDHLFEDLIKRINSAGKEEGHG